MPELPEVETLRRGLEHTVTARCIVNVVIANPKALKGQSETVFRNRVIDSQIAQVTRRGKYLLLPLMSAAKASANSSAEALVPSGENAEPSPFFLCIHLKMRGQLLLESVSAARGAYHCVSLDLDNGESLRFYDMWTWGEMRALSAQELQQVAGLAQMGDEPLEPGWGADALTKKISGRKGPIKPLLLDQKTVAGVGNIYADESLFRAGINPQRAAGSLSVEETTRLADAIRTVLTEAVEGGGTMSEDYVDLAGQVGRFTPQVYDRGGAPCMICGTELTRIRLGGRGTVFCGTCQKP